MFLSKKNEKGEYIFNVLFGKNKKTDYIHAIAEAHAIDLIAKTIAKCEIQVYKKQKNKIKKVKNEIYWALNIQPNYYENGTSFIYKLVVKLLIYKKALVLIHKDIRGDPLLYIADDFTPNNSVLYGKFFSDVKISDDEGNTIDMTKKYDSENSIYYSIVNNKLKTASNSFKDKTAEILGSIEKTYKIGNTPKWRIKNTGFQPTLRDAETGEEIDYKTYINKITDGLTDEKESVFILSELFDLINVNKDIGAKNLNDYVSQAKQITDTVAQEWNIPLDVFYGTKTEKSMGTSDFITFAVEPYIEMLEDGFNIGIVGKQDYLKGEQIKVNKYNITHKDIIDSANGIDKLMSDGFSRNEINELLALPEIDEEWANKHYVTKNYANTEGGVQKNEIKEN